MPLWPCSLYRNLVRHHNNNNNIVCAHCAQAITYFSPFCQRLLVGCAHSESWQTVWSNFGVFMHLLIEIAQNPFGHERWFLPRVRSHRTHSNDKQLHFCHLNDFHQCSKWQKKNRFTYLFVCKQPTNHQPNRTEPLNVHVYRTIRNLHIQFNFRWKHNSLHTHTCTKCDARGVKNLVDTAQPVPRAHTSPVTSQSAVHRAAHTRHNII